MKTLHAVVVATGILVVACLAIEDARRSTSVHGDTIVTTFTRDGNKVLASAVYGTGKRPADRIVRQQVIVTNNTVLELIDAGGAPHPLDSFRHRIS